MLGPKGNPRANNLFAVIGKLQRVSGVRLAVASGSRKQEAGSVGNLPDDFDNGRFPNQKRQKIL